jgi:hypothetical protein
MTAVMNIVSSKTRCELLLTQIRGCDDGHDRLGVRA